MNLWGVFTFQNKQKKWNEEKIMGGTISQEEENQESGLAKPRGEENFGKMPYQRLCQGLVPCCKKRNSLQSVEASPGVCFNAES